jgi:hypothetical protein
MAGLGAEFAMTSVCSCRPKNRVTAFRGSRRFPEHEQLLTATKLLQYVENSFDQAQDTDNYG